MAGEQGNSRKMLLILIIQLLVIFLALGAIFAFTLSATEGSTAKSGSKPYQGNAHHEVTVPKLPKDFMKDFDLSDIRLPYDDNLGIVDSPGPIRPNPACHWSVNWDKPTVLQTMPKSPNECWKTVENGISTEKWSVYGASHPFITAEISDPTYEDFNGDGFLDVAFGGVAEIPKISGEGVTYLLIANVAQPDQPFAVSVGRSMQATETYQTFYKGGLFALATVNTDSPEPENPLVKNYKFVTRPDSITVEPTPTRGKEVLAHFQ
ncbi:hypothetical protein [uncultured Mobiluncus sp.]|uniref:hypothetical protein n=1 Tax=uncultured Mobiluncus sp. TaxID=293425 RepID=UPI0025E71DA0|nr:hypothetical protein [uncultured Mobiluncus sp.]